MKYLLCFLGWLAGIALIYVFPHRSLLAAIGVLLFAGFSLALLALFVGSAARLQKSGRRKVGVALLGGLVLLLALFIFRPLNAPGDEVEIEKTIEAVTTGADPSYCDTEVTASYLKQTTGAKAPFADDICQGEAEASRAKSVDVSEIAINGNKATAVVALRGGSFDGSRVVLRLLEEDGTWKVDRLLAFRNFDRDKFERAYRRTFLESGAPVRSADCAVRRAQRFSTAEIESAALTGVVRWTFAPISVSCDRDGVERSLVKSIAEPKFGLPSRAIQCAAQKTKALSDAELVRVELSPIVYDELLYSCGRKAIFAYQRRELKAREHLNAAEVQCVLSAFRNRPTPSAIRLGYDEPRYNALIAACRG